MNAAKMAVRYIATNSKVLDALHGDAISEMVPDKNVVLNNSSTVYLIDCPAPNRRTNGNANPYESASSFNSVIPNNSPRVITVIGSVIHKIDATKQEVTCRSYGIVPHNRPWSPEDDYAAV